MSSGSGGSQNTVTQSQAIPAFEQQESQQNQALANSLGSQPYPVYQGALSQPFTPLQQQGQQMAVNAAGSYQPGLNQATGVTQGALNPGGVNYYSGTDAGIAGNAVNPAGVNYYSGADAGVVGNAVNPGGVNAYSQAAANTLGTALQTNASTPGAISAYMNPYIQQALAPQVQQLNLQLAQQQQGINAQATQSNAFGDARQGAMSALQNLYGNQAMNQLLGTGYNDAYSSALQALQGQQTAGINAAGQFANLGNLQNAEQNTQLQGANQFGNLASLQNAEQNTQLQGAGQFGNLAGLQNTEQNTQLQGANQLASLAGQQQSMGITGANAVYAAGQQQQALGQSQLNTAYQQYLNQVNWPYQMLNVQESSLSNSPYNVSTAVQLPTGNATAQGIGGLTSLAGLLGSLGSGGGGSGAAPNVFGAA